MGIVTAVGVAVSQQATQQDLRLQAAMNAAIHACLAEGLSPETDADAIRFRMKAAHDLELDAITEGR